MIGNDVMAEHLEDWGYLAAPWVQPAALAGILTDRHGLPMDAQDLLPPVWDVNPPPPEVTRPDHPQPDRDDEQPHSPDADPAEG